MTKNNYIMRKPYVSPTVSFEGIEDDALLWSNSANTEVGGSGQGTGSGDGWGNGEDFGDNSKQAPYDFVFQYD